MYQKKGALGRGNASNWRAFLLRKTENSNLLAGKTPSGRSSTTVILGDARGVHLETTVSGIATVAGCLLLRSTNVRLDKLTPGQAVFVEAVNELGRKHFEFLSAACVALEIEPRLGWTDPVPPDHQPLKTALELTRLLEPVFVSLCDQLAVPVPARSRLALFTAVKEGQEILRPEVGKAIILSALVAGSKTVPHPFRPPANQPSPSLA